MGLRILILIMLARVASADPPTGYKCGPGGRVLKDKGCACPKEKIDARDADGKAICAPKPPPAATACLKERAGKYVVKIDTQPQGAVIFLGDKACGAVGTTPWTGKLVAGPMIVTLERHSYEPKTRTFEVTAAKKPQELVVPLARTNVGTVKILADADPNVVDAEVLIDDKLEGKAPLELKVRGGRRKLELRKQGFQSFTQWIEVEDAVAINVLPVLVVPTVATGRLFVDADVPGAEVVVNGTRRGTTPLAIDKLPLGTYTIEVTKPPAKPFTATVDLARGDNSVFAKLAGTVAKATSGTLRVTSKLPGDVLVDGKAIGTMPIEVQLPAGDYWLRVVSAGYYPWEKRITIEADKRLELTPELAKSARLTITSTPPGAAVFIDGRRFGATPYTTELVAGKHTIIVEKPGFQRHTVAFDLQADKALDVTLKR